VLPRRVPLVEQELLTLPEHLSSPRLFSGVRVTWSLVLYVCFVYRCLSFCTFSFGHCGVCSSSIYGFWYLQTLLKLCLIKLYIETKEKYTITILLVWPENNMQSIYGTLSQCFACSVGKEYTININMEYDPNYVFLTRIDDYNKVKN
jgi:hypothetical protein